MKRLAVLLSGRGSNFLAIHDAITRGELVMEIVAVISSRESAPGIQHARDRGLPAFVMNHRDYPSRTAHEEAILAVLRERSVDIVALAGYMRRITTTLIEPFRGRILNIHPSLLPSFAGLDAQAQAIEYGVRISGCTVHLVDELVDHGPILVQRSVPVLDSDDADALAARILEQEHVAYVEALKILCGPCRIEGRRVRVGVD